MITRELEINNEHTYKFKAILVSITGVTVVFYEKFGLNRLCSTSLT